MTEQRLPPTTCNADCRRPYLMHECTIMHARDHCLIKSRAASLGKWAERAAPKPPTSLMMRDAHEGLASIHQCAILHLLSVVLPAGSHDGWLGWLTVRRWLTDCVDEVLQDISVGLQRAVWALQGSNTPHHD